MSEENKLMAFWKYDQFPYLLGGTITKVMDDGIVKIHEYGNSCFRPVFIVPKSQGEELLNELESLRKEHRKELDNILKSNKIKANNLLSKFNYKI